MRLTRGARAERLLDAHLGPHTARGPYILQPGAPFCRDELPTVEDRVVGAQRVRHIIGLAAVPHDPILIEDLPARNCASVRWTVDCADNGSPIDIVATTRVAWIRDS